MNAISRAPRSNAVASVAAVALVLSGCTAGTSAGDPSFASSPTSSPASSPSPAARVRPLVDLGGGGIRMGAGTYVLDRFPVHITFDVPDGDPPGWHVGKSEPYAAILLWNTPPDFTYAVAFWDVDNVYVDPCEAAARELDPPLGPSVDDLVSYLSSQPAFEATTPVDIMVGAFPGKAIELTKNLDSQGNCPDAHLFSAGDDGWGLEPGETIQMRVFEVDGVRIVVTIHEWAETDAAVHAELYQIVDSIRLAPPL